LNAKFPLATVSPTCAELPNRILALIVTLYYDDDYDEGRINFSVALSPIRLQEHVTISLNSEVT